MLLAALGGTVGNDSITGEKLGAPTYNITRIGAPFWGGVNTHAPRLSHAGSYAVRPVLSWWASWPAVSHKPAVLGSASLFQDYLLWELQLGVMPITPDTGLAPTTHLTSSEPSVTTVTPLSRYAPLRL